MKKVAVAFSSGVDSTLVLAVAKKLRGEKGIALTVSTEFQPAHEVDAAKDIAGKLEVKHHTVHLKLLNNPQISQNPEDRCYLCKKSLLAAIARSAKEQGFDVVVDGTNADDARTTRPGLRALHDLGVRSPLVDACMTKEEVRAASDLLGLPTKDKPSNPCLATRIPFYSPLTLDKLRMVDEAETRLRELGFPESRVRHHDDIARIEIPVAMFGDALEKREQIVQLIKEAGFIYAALDLHGYRTGSLEESVRREKP